MERDITQERKSFRTMYINELKAQVDVHGDVGKSLKRKSDYIELLESLGRAKYAHREEEDMVCGLSDELWGIVAAKLLKTGVRSAVQLGKTCRQLRRVVSKSGLWASLMSVLVEGTTIAEDGTSAVLSNGFTMTYDMCEEAVQAIELMIPSLCFKATVENGGTLTMPPAWGPPAEFHKLGYLLGEGDNLLHIFKLRQCDMRNESILVKNKDLLYAVTDAIPASKILGIAFRKVKSVWCIQNLRRSVLHRTHQFTVRCVEFQMAAKERELVLPLYFFKRAQKVYVSEQRTLEESLEILRMDQTEILYRNRYVQLQEALEPFNLSICTLSKCCLDFVFGKDPNATLEGVVDKMRESNFYYQFTSYAAFRSRVLVVPDSDLLSFEEVIDLCLNPSFFDSSTEQYFLDVYKTQTWDDTMDWTPIGMKIKLVALFWHLKDSSTAVELLPPSLAEKARIMRQRMLAIAQQLHRRSIRLKGKRAALSWVCKATLASSEPLDKLFVDPVQLDEILKMQDSAQAVFDPYLHWLPQQPLQS